MGFTPKTWVAGQDNGWVTDSSEMNRIEQGIIEVIAKEDDLEDAAGTERFVYCISENTLWYDKSDTVDAWVQVNATGS